MHRMEKTSEWHIHVYIHTHKPISEVNSIGKKGVVVRERVWIPKSKPSWASCGIKISYLEKNGSPEEVDLPMWHAPIRPLSSITAPTILLYFCFTGFSFSLFMSSFKTGILFYLYFVSLALTILSNTQEVINKC